MGKFFFWSFFSSRKVFPAISFIRAGMRSEKAIHMAAVKFLRQKGESTQILLIRCGRMVYATVQVSFSPHKTVADASSMKWF